MVLILCGDYGCFSGMLRTWQCRARLVGGVLCGLRRTADGAAAQVHEWLSGGGLSMPGTTPALNPVLNVAGSWENKVRESRNW